MMNKIRRLRYFAFILTMLGQGSLTLCIPSFPLLAHHFGVSTGSIKLSMTYFLLAYGLSQLIYGPISDYLGRKKVLILGLAILFFGSVEALFAHHLFSYNLARVIQGLGAGASMVLIRSSLRDVSSGKDYSKSMSYLSMGFAVGVGLFPFVGGSLTEHIGWTSVFLFLALATLITLLLVWRYYPETVTGSKKESSQPNSSLGIVKITEQAGLVMRSTQFLLALGAGMCAYTVILIYNAMTPFFVQNEIGWSPQAYSSLFVLVAIPYWLGSVFNAALSEKLSMKSKVYLGLSSIFLGAIAMFLVAEITHHHNIYGLVIPFCLCILGQGLIWSNAMALALNPFYKYAGLASSIFSFLQLVIASIINVFLSIIPDNSLIPISLGLLFFAIVSLILFNVFFKNKKKH